MNSIKKSYQSLSHGQDLAGKPQYEKLQEMCKVFRERLKQCEASEMDKATSTVGYAESAQRKDPRHEAKLL